MNRLSRSLIPLTVLSALAVSTPQNARAQVAYDDFDTSMNLLSRTITPDLSGNSIPGTFPGSRFDVFGIVDRNVNFDFADDSAGSFPPDTFGILKTGKTDKVFGVEDLLNNDNPSASGSAVWVFDISGYTDLFISIDFAAMGDFEDANDSFLFTASIDGGPAIPLFSSDVREDLDQTYTMESGTQVVLNDPLAINNVLLSNSLQTLQSGISGTGSLLTVQFAAMSDGGGEVFLFDNLRIGGTQAVPEPGSLALLAGSALAGFFALKRRRRS